MSPRKSKPIQLELFTELVAEIRIPKGNNKQSRVKDMMKNLYQYPQSRKSQQLPPFEQLYIAIQEIIKDWKQKAQPFPFHATILQNRYLEGKKDKETAKQFGISSERIRQIRVKLIEQLMNQEEEKQVHLIPELSSQLKSMIPKLPAEDPDKMLRSKGGKVLPYTLLDFTEMTYLEERQMADQSFIAPYEQANALRRHIGELIKLLRSHYTPIEESFINASLSDILPTTCHIPFNEEWIQRIIHGSHRWIETQGTLVGLRYENLHFPSLKLARIIYEHKKLHREEILRIYNEREPEGNKTDNPTIQINRKDPRFQCQGKSGIWTFQEKPPRSEASVSQVLHRYTLAHDGLINLLEAERHVKSLGYDYPLHTLRCYLLRDCVSAVENPNLLCHQKYTQNYPEIRWRSRISVTRKSPKMPAYYYDIINKVKELLAQADENRLPRKEIVKVCKGLVPGNINGNIVYKIIGNKMEDSVVLERIGTTEYLQLKEKQ